jgi:NDP-sugar pyrophosphorylase family protein
MKPTLVILAAGMASRYGSMKQTEGFGPYGETIMDYSIYDAIRAGFTKVVFIIRKDFADAFRANFDAKLSGKIEVEYVYQEMDAFVEGGVPAFRTKPWGTAHAVLCARNAVDSPFAVINADDFYGRDAFEKACHFLNQACTEKNAAIIGYRLDKTLSKHGTVSRGVCETDAQNHLVSIVERTKIYSENETVYYEDENGKQSVEGSRSVSMNFWCFPVSIFDISAELFKAFIVENKSNPKAEFFIPIVADHFIRELNGVIQVIPTSSEWFGVTYKEDAPMVRENLMQLLDAGVYPQKLW